MTTFVPDPEWEGVGLRFVSGVGRALGLSLGTALLSGLHYSPVEGGPVAEAEERLRETMATGSMLGVHCILCTAAWKPQSPGPPQP